jgi:hypothetical protein
MEQPLMMQAAAPRDEFAFQNMDPNSHKVRQEYLRLHKSSRKLDVEMQQAATDCVANVRSRHAHAVDFLNYQQLLAGLLHNDEKVQLNGAPLDYKRVGFQDIDQSGWPTDWKAPGQLVLTNKRILFLSATEFEQMGLEQFGEPKKKQGGYSVEFKKSNTMWYFPIDLQNFKHASFFIDIGNSATVSVHNGSPSCCCFCDPCCPKYWERQPLQSPPMLNGRKLEMGVLMPPWLTRKNVIVELSEACSLTLAQSFLSTFERLRGGFQHAPQQQQFQ